MSRALQVHCTHRIKGSKQNHQASHKKLLVLHNKNFYVIPISFKIHEYFLLEIGMLSVKLNRIRQLGETHHFSIHTKR